MAEYRAAPANYVPGVGRGGTYAGKEVTAEVASSGSGGMPAGRGRGPGPAGPAKRRRAEEEDGLDPCDPAFYSGKAPAPPPSLPYKVDTSRPSLRTNWTRRGVRGRRTARLMGSRLRVRAPLRACLAAAPAAPSVRTKLNTLRCRYGGKAGQCADGTAAGALFQSRPLPSPGDIIRRMASQDAMKSASGAVKGKIKKF